LGSIAALIPCARSQKVEFGAPAISGMAANVDAVRIATQLLSPLPELVETFVSLGCFFRRPIDDWDQTDHALFVDSSKGKRLRRIRVSAASL
jgi:hypothetical protein